MFCLGNKLRLSSTVFKTKKHEIFTSFFVFKIVKLAGKHVNLQDKRAYVSVKKLCRECRRQSVLSLLPYFYFGTNKASGVITPHFNITWKKEKIQY